ncbi:MAG: RnjA, partial [Candidatus Adlerbacteria bacterium GW2011_GWC1_50_9]
MKRQEDFKQMPKPKIELITTESKVRLGNFLVEFYHINHNIPDSVGVVLRTPVGTVVHTGDFKFDPQPVSEATADLRRIAEIGRQGVLLLVSESTDADSPG